MAKFVVGGLLAASVILGGLMYRRYVASERLVRAAAADLETRGRSLGGEECVSSVLDWGRSCAAMKVVCEEAVGPLVRTCLQARDRTDYCGTLGARLDTHFSFERCRERGYGRRNRLCAEAYLAVVGHCRALTEAGPAGGGTPSAGLP
jgi:hypothetical protein